MISILRKHLHTTGLLVLLLLTASLGFSQGSETFTNIPTDNAGQYNPRTWTGDNGETWNATEARTDQTINGKAITLRNGEVSTTIPGGIGDLIVTTQRKFSGGSGVISVSINGTTLATTIPFSSTSQTTTISGINESGAVDLVLTQGTGDRVAIDDITWSGFGGGGNTGPFITNITRDPNTVITSSDAVSISATIIDSDGIASAELHWGTASGSYTSTINMSLDAGNVYVTDSDIPVQADGTTVYYVIEATDLNATPLSTTSPEESYTVEDPLPFTIPYYNAFANQTDYNAAVTDGFEFTSASQSGSYVKITSGSIVTPAIDFSAYDALKVKFDLATWGGGGGVLTVSVSNDNGANYTPLGTFAPTSPTLAPQEQVINLASLNGANGRIKFEQTGGSNSLRFNELHIDNTTVVNEGPEITNIVQAPDDASVTSADTVLVSADITDSDGVASAVLNWGTASGSLGTTINMSDLGGGEYYTDTDIPTQTAGTTVYYNIVAIDGNATPETTTSAEYSYTVLSAANPYPVITNITQAPDAGSVTSTDDVIVTADITTLGATTITSAVLNWGTASGALNNPINMSYVSGDEYWVDSEIPAQADGTTVYYEIVATNSASNTTTSDEQSYTVADPLPFTLPYFNGLRDADDVTEAEGYGFAFNNAALETGGDGYIKINMNGSIVTPAINISANNKLIVNFDMRTWGSGNNREFSVLISEDNTAFTSVETYIVPSDYITFKKVIDLSSLSGTEGYIKFEMTGGTAGSVRFRDLNMKAFNGYFYSSESWSPGNPNVIGTNPTDDLYIADGTASLTADLTFNDITINTGATLNIEKILTIQGNIDNQGDLVFVSTLDGDGELAEVPTTSTITGNATVQRYMSENRSYRMVSPAVTTSNFIIDNWQEGVHNTGLGSGNNLNPHPGFGTHITGSPTGQNGFDATATGNPSMFTANDMGQTFDEIDNTNAITLKAGNPYLLFVRGSRSIDLGNDESVGHTVLRATGSLFKGTNTQTFNVPAVAPGHSAFIMFGNPYQSAVDMSLVFANVESTNLNTDHFYVYDPNGATYGNYVIVADDGGTWGNTAGSAANQYLQPGQAAQVATVADGEAKVVFKEENKAPGNHTRTNRPMSGRNMLTVQLYTTENFNNDGPVHDSFGIQFSEDYDNEITLSDAAKPMNFYENLGIDHNGTLLGLERREMPQPSEVFPLYSSGYSYSDYTLKMIVDGLEDVSLYLDDHYTGTSTLVEEGESSYNFTVDSTDPMSIATDRFAFRVEQRLGVEDNNVLAGIRLFPNPLNADTFYINAPRLNGQQLMVNISDMSGRNIYAQTLDCHANTVAVPMGSNLASGIYLVTLKQGGEAQTYRLIKE